MLSRCWGLLAEQWPGAGCGRVGWDKSYQNQLRLILMTLPALGLDDEVEGLEIKEVQGVGASQRGGCIQHSASCKKVWRNLYFQKYICLSLEHWLVGEDTKYSLLYLLIRPCTTMFTQVKVRSLSQCLRVSLYLYSSRFNIEQNNTLSIIPCLY